MAKVLPLHRKIFWQRMQQVDEAEHHCIVHKRKLGVDIDLGRVHGTITKLCLMQQGANCKTSSRGSAAPTGSKLQLIWPMTDFGHRRLETPSDLPCLPMPEKRQRSSREKFRRPY